MKSNRGVPTAMSFLWLSVSPTKCKKMAVYPSKWFLALRIIFLSFGGYTFNGCFAATQMSLDFIDPHVGNIETRQTRAGIEPSIFAPRIGIFGVVNE